MRKLEREDILDIAAYERARDGFRAKVIALKKPRRIEIGDRITLVFENRDTVLFQVQEMMRAERIVREEAIANELDAYNPLVPGKDELSATLFIEVTQQEKIKEYLDQLMGIDAPDTVYFALGPRLHVYAEFEAGHSKEDKLSAVHFVRFRFAPEARRAFLDPTVPISLVVAHPNYKARTQLSAESRQALVQDLLAT